MILTLSPSSIDTLMECPTKYNYSSLQRLAPIEEDRSKMDRGTLFHEMLAMHYNLIIANELTSNQIILAVTELARERARNDVYPIDMAEECISNYQDYAIFYASDGWIPKFVETPFSKELYKDEERSIILEGRMDLIVEGPGNMIYPVDHKTEERKDQANQLSNQFMAYCWATESLSFVKNAIGFQKSYGPSQRYHRDVMSYTKEALDEWRENVIYYGLTLMQYIETGHFPMNYSSCRFCRFKNICNTTKDTRNFKIESMYTKRPEYDIFGSA